MVFQGRHGYYEHEQVRPQRFEVDVELVLNLQPAAVDDDLEQTVDYARVYRVVRQIVESTTYRLLEALVTQMKPATGPETGIVGIYTGGAWVAERLHRALGRMRTVLAGERA